MHFIVVGFEDAFAWKRLVGVFAQIAIPAIDRAPADAKIALDFGLCVA
jgi:hypothetical protein